MTPPQPTPRITAEATKAALGEINNANRRHELPIGHHVQSLLDAREDALKAPDGGLVDLFIADLFNRLAELGVDATDCDGYDDPATIIAHWIQGRDDDRKEAQDQNAALTARLAEVEKERQFPDIGPDPLKLNGEERKKAADETYSRLTKAHTVQQKGVPDQTALVWRIDLSRADMYRIIENNKLKSAQAERDTALRDLGTLREELAAKWQPIETAPKDGTEIIGRCDDSLSICSWESLDNPVAKHWGISGTWHRKAIASGKDLMGAFSPTHWMPLPQPPLDLAAAKAGKEQA